MSFYLSSKENIFFKKEQSIPTEKHRVINLKDDISVGDDLITSKAVYKIIEKIGRGGGGDVFFATSMDSKYAIKKIYIGEGVRKKLAEKELSFLEHLSKHPICNEYIICYYDHIFTNYYLYIIMELATGKTLRQLIRENQITLKNKLLIMYHLAKGLFFIHEKGICHRDIKLDNILVDDKFNIKYIDFGLSCFEKDCVKEFVGSAGYISPEVSGIFIPKSNLFDCKSTDIYSLGVVFWQIMNGEYRWVGLIQSFKPLPISDSNNDKIDDLINSMLSQNPDERPITEQILREIVGGYNDP